MKFFFKDFVMSSGRFNLPLQQTKVLFFPELMAVLGFWNAFFLRVSSSEKKRKMLNEILF